MQLFVGNGNWMRNFSGVPLVVLAFPAEGDIQN